MFISKSCFVLSIPLFALFKLYPWSYDLIDQLLGWNCMEKVFEMGALVAN